MAGTALTYSLLDDESLPEVARLFVRVFNGSPWNEEWTEETAHRRLSEILHGPGGFGILATLAGQLVAFAVGAEEQRDKGRHFRLCEVGVLPELNSQGIGSSILGELNERLRGAGIEDVYLVTARGVTELFYARNDYRVNDRLIIMTTSLTS